MAEEWSVKISANEPDLENRDGTNAFGFDQLDAMRRWVGDRPAIRNEIVDIVDSWENGRAGSDCCVKGDCSCDGGSDLRDWNVDEITNLGTVEEFVRQVEAAVFSGMVLVDLTHTARGCNELVGKCVPRRRAGPESQEAQRAESPDHCYLVGWWAWIHRELQRRYERIINKKKGKKPPFDDEDCWAYNHCFIHCMLTNAGLPVSWSVVLGVVWEGYEHVLFSQAGLEDRTISAVEDWPTRFIYDVWANTEGAVCGRQARGKRHAAGGKVSLIQMSTECLKCCDDFLGI